MRFYEEWLPQGKSKIVLQTKDADIYIATKVVQRFLHNPSDHIRADLERPEMYRLELAPIGRITVLLTSEEVDGLLSDAADVLEGDLIVPDEREDITEE